MIQRLAGLAPLGSLLRTVTAIAFPSVAVLDDGLPAVGILLYLGEIVLSSAMLYARTGLAHLITARAVASGGAPVRGRASFKDARDHASLTIGIGLLCSPFLVIAAMIDAPDVPLPTLLETVLDRGRWMALCILVSGVIDTVIAPVRSSQWLKASAERQMRRVWLMHPVILFGFLLYAATGSLVGMLVLFFLVRVSLDAQAWRRAFRERDGASWLAAGVG